MSGGVNYHIPTTNQITVYRGDGDVPRLDRGGRHRDIGSTYNAFSWCRIGNRATLQIESKPCHIRNEKLTCCEVGINPFIMILILNSVVFLDYESWLVCRVEGYGCGRNQTFNIETNLFGTSINAWTYISNKYT